MKKSKTQELVKVKFWISIVAFAMVVFLMKYFLSQGLVDVENTGGVWERFFVFIAFMLVVPIFTVKYIFKEKLSDYYFNFKFEQWALIRFFVLSSLFLGVVFYLVIYLDKGNIITVQALGLFGLKFLFLIDLLITPIILLAREFFFRGFLLKNSVEFLGFAGGVVLNIVLFLLFFFFINSSESFLSFFGDWQEIILLIVFNFVSIYFAYSSKSIVYSFLFSWAFVLLADVMLKLMLDDLLI